MSFLDLCGVYTGTTGTGTLTLGSAIPGLLTLSGASAVDATVYDYSIANGSDREVGYGTYTAAGPTLTRNLVKSTTGSLLNLTGTSEVRMTPRAASLGDVVGPASSTDNTLPRYHLTTGKIIQGSGIVVDDSGNVSGMGTLDVSAITASGAVAVPDDAYAVGWNGSANVPTKNAVYDKIELMLGTTLPAAYQPLDSDLTSWADVTRASGFDTFTATPTAANLRSLMTDGPPESIVIACSDEISNLTTGTAKVKFRMPYAFTLTEVRASLSTAQSAGSIFTVDVNEGGITILSTKLTIDNTELTSTTAAAAPVISDTSLADDAEMSVDIDQVGTAGAIGLKVVLIGYRP